MELNHLRSFIRSVELGSFAAAAEALSYTGPAISQHVAALEGELGVELLERLPRGVAPTPAGEVLYQRAVRLLDEATGIASEIHQIASTPRVLRIGAFPTAAQYLLPGVFTEFPAQHPDPELVLMVREPPAGYHEILSGYLDLLITHRYTGTAEPDNLGLTVEPLFEDPLLLVAHRDHPGAALHAPEELADATWIAGPPGVPDRVALETAAAAIGFEPNVGFENTDYAVTVTLVSSGLGAAFIPGLVFTNTSNDNLTVINVDTKIPMSRTISLVHRSPIRYQALSDLITALRGALPEPALRSM